MPTSSTQKLIFFVIIVLHLSIVCVATIFPESRCRRPGFRSDRRTRYCTLQRRRIMHSCDFDEVYCNVYTDIRDCLLPGFQCQVNGRCIPRTFRCNGILDCRDGSDERGCHTTSSYSITTNTVLSESEKDTSSFITTTSTMLRDTEVKTTFSSFATAGRIFQESATNTISSSTRISERLLESKDATSSSSTSTTFSDSESNAGLLSSTRTSPMPSHSESMIGLPSSTKTNTMLSDFESPTTLSLPSFKTSTMLSVIFPDYNEKTSTPLSSTMLSDSESYTDPPSFTTSIKHPDSTLNIALPSSTTPKKTLLEYEENTSSSITDATMLPSSSAMRSCPDNYCMQNAKCEVVQGQYHCNCPSSFIGEHCEIQLRTKQDSHKYAVAIVIFCILVIFCVAVLSMCVYRYKRLSSAWKSYDVTSRTLSQLTLTSHDVE